MNGEDYAWYQLIARATYLRLRLRYQLIARATYLRCATVALTRNTDVFRRARGGTFGPRRGFQENGIPERKGARDRFRERGTRREA